ncbi:hypothetical protein ABOM_005036 [Aspergillus bombycis]|uniref:Carboxymuconolactone decarboxylase-like domain-containing protein n=1 Tax=Aspergillus bombycis TaxID=109264 RepID=A0A1F8A6D4_9EURO|nr:hypothetical protein ABOM_005036 [Aspergillus bombycis]OGM46858.1 hypothetical protein ABOM_005036 [Aspergillus bombycis]
MRLPYAPQSPEGLSADTQEIYSRIAARRTPRPLIPLDLTLLHAPQVADGYNSFVGALRSKTILHADFLELSISRIAVLNKAVYEWNIHAPLALTPGSQHQSCSSSSHYHHLPKPPKEVRKPGDRPASELGNEPLLLILMR